MDNARREEMYRGWDKNADGTLTIEELPGEWRGEFGRRVSVYGVSPTGPWPIDQLMERRKAYRGGDEPSAAASATGPQTFGQAPTKAAPRAFGAAAGSAVGVGEYEVQALKIMGQYDRNENGQLDRRENEWERIGNAEAADANRDGAITLAELVARLRYKATVGGSSSTVASGDKKTATAAKPASGQKKSYRFLPARERLPKDIPGWFTSKDRDGDGQVAMAEYSSRWTEREADAFARYDADGDGFIGTEEALRGN
jgi:hypothetical protein